MVSTLCKAISIKISPHIHMPKTEKCLQNKTIFLFSLFVNREKSVI